MEESIIFIDDSVNEESFVSVNELEGVCLSQLTSVLLRIEDLKSSSWVSFPLRVLVLGEQGIAVVETNLLDAVWHLDVDNSTV